MHGSNVIDIMRLEWMDDCVFAVQVSISVHMVLRYLHGRVEQPR